MLTASSAAAAIAERMRRVSGQGWRAARPVPRRGRAAAQGLLDDHLVHGLRQRAIGERDAHRRAVERHRRAGGLPDEKLLILLRRRAEALAHVRADLGIVTAVEADFIEAIGDEPEEGGARPQALEGLVLGAVVRHGHGRGGRRGGRRRGGHRLQRRNRCGGLRERAAEAQGAEAVGQRGIARRRGGCPQRDGEGGAPERRRSQGSTPPRAQP
jgi:hypothetical protein